MAYKSKQLINNEIPVNSSGASLGGSHQLYKNAVVYVDASMDSVLINNVTHYFYEKFDPRDFSKKYKGIISQENILAAFNDIKKIIKEKEIKIEEGKKKIYLIFLQKNENEKADVIFILRKKQKNDVNSFYFNFSKQWMQKF